MRRTLCLSFFVLFSSAAWATPKPLFHKGREIFRVVNEKLQTPVFHLLNSSPAKKTIATAVNAAFNLSSGSESSVDVKLEKIFLAPVKGQNNEIAMTLLVSGQEVELASTLKRSELEAGKLIQVQLPNESRDFEMLKLTSSGQFSMQYLKSQDALRIEKAILKINVESPLSDEEPETLQFSGRALRQNP